MKQHIIPSLLFGVVLANSVFAASRTAPLVVDHTYDLAQLPTGVVTSMEASSPLVHYAHRSDGSAVPWGLSRLRDANQTQYPFTSGNFSAPALNQGIRFWVGMTAEGYVTPGLYWQTKAGRDDLTAILTGSAKIEYASWTWCNEDDYYGLGDPTDGYGLGTYIRTMDSLERLFPSVTFIYQTAAMRDAGSDASNIHQAIFNDSLRRWAIHHNKVLFDVADLDVFYKGVMHTETFAQSATKDTTVVFQHPSWLENFGPTGNGHHANDSMGVDKGKAWIFLMSRLYMEKQGIANSSSTTALSSSMPSSSALSSSIVLFSSSASTLHVRNGHVVTTRNSSGSMQSFDLRGRRIH
jgi:hypothetical protein